MTSERGRQVEELYHAAVECDPDLSRLVGASRKSGEGVLNWLLDDLPIEPTVPHLKLHV
jgi:hypothetical protein